MYNNEVSEEVASAMRWAATDIAATGTRKWYYCGCGGPQASQYTRSWNGHESWAWRIYTVSVTVPRYSPEMVRDLLRDAADRVSKHGICEHQCTYIYNPRLPDGGLMVASYIENMLVDGYPCTISVTVTGPKCPPPEIS